MKMVIAIVRDLDEDEILKALLEEEFRVTRIASSGGFFRRGNATLMIGVDELKVDQVIQIIRERCAPTLDLAVKHATVFVLDIDRFEQV
ncbi:MAG: hypothetical protein HN855_12010 [Anaerolineae bacterium]|nr:hypothetical protein [Anaerolineae bacterium]MBT7070972.1 hypothetical protein [Anaerolineae bacterium]MBT7325878.1 hypothetical protein [Anaerolineae bacterium]